MLSENSSGAFTSPSNRRYKIKNAERIDQWDSIQPGNRVPYEHKIIKDTTSNYCDDGYLSLAAAKINGKTENVTPTNSWPLRRKVTAKELKEFGDKLDSGSSLLLETRTAINRTPRHSVGSHCGGTLLIEQDTTPNTTDQDNCRSSIEQCIDYCTCMVCIKSAFYLCSDDQDDTGNAEYDPCFCSAPSRACCSRWSLLGLLACLMPCLMCYPVARCCLTRYDRCTANNNYSNKKTKRKRFRIKFSKSGEPHES